MNKDKLIGCRNCKLWNRAAATDKSGRILSNRVARCLWISTEPWPDSVMLWLRPKPSYTSANDGASCQCFMKR